MLISAVYSFLLLTSNPQYEYHNCQTIRLLKDVWAVSSIWWRWIKLLCTFVCGFLYEPTCHFFRTDSQGSNCWISWYLHASFLHVHLELHQTVLWFLLQHRYNLENSRRKSRSIVFTHISALLCSFFFSDIPKFFLLSFSIYLEYFL